MTSRRSSIDIVYGILRLLRLQDASKNEVMYAVNLSHYQTIEYLSWLQEVGVLDKLQGGVRHVSYRATKKGLKLLGNIETMLEMFRGSKGSAALGSSELIIRDGSCSKVTRYKGDDFGES